MGNPVDAVFGNNKPPPPPDYAGAAEQTAAGDLEIAKYQTLANRPDEYGPEGSRTWQQGPDPSNPDATKWTATTTLNPEAQKAYDMGQRMDTGLAGLGVQGVEQMIQATTHAIIVEKFHFVLPQIQLIGSVARGPLADAVNGLASDENIANQYQEAAMSRHSSS